MANRSADVLEIFSSIQGEGLYIGERQIFIRFDNCNLNCNYCDAPKNIKSIKFDIEEVISKIKELNKKAKHKTISLTGGEPLLQAEFLKALLPEFKRLKFKILLETNATLSDNLKKVLRYIDIISADIKLPSVAKARPCWKEHIDFIRLARKKNIFVKTVVSKELKMDDFKKAVYLIKNIDDRIPLVLQPATRNLQPVTNISCATLLALQSYALKFLKNVLVIPQAHKILGVR